MSSSTPSIVFSETAFEATLLWLSNEYDACLQTLEKLENSGTTDFKVQHNSCIAEFYSHGDSDWRKVLKQLTDLKANHETSKTKAGAESEFHPDLALLDLNRGIALYQLQEYSDALAVLEPLYASVECLSSGAGLRLCLLLLDVCIKCGQPARAAGVLAFTEKAATYLFKDFILYPSDPTTSPPSTANGHHAASPDDTSPTSPPASPPPSSPPATDPNLQPTPLPRLSRPSCQAVRKAQELSLQHPPSTSTTPQEFKILLRLARTRVHLATRNHKAAKRELRALLASAPSSAEAELLRAEFELSRHHLKKAQRLLLGLSQGGPGTEGGSAGGAADAAARGAPLMNAMGVLHHQLGKHRMAGLYFARALAGCGGAEQEAEKWSPEAYSVLYNWGLQHLLLGNFPLAFKCFQQAGLRYHQQPLLWLRIAESALGTAATVRSSQAEAPPANARGNGGGPRGRGGRDARGGNSTRDAKASPPLLTTSEAFGPYKPTPAPPGATRNTLQRSQSHPPLLLPAAAPASQSDDTPLLQYAVACLQGALTLLDTPQPDPPSTASTPGQAPAAPTNPTPALPLTNGASTSTAPSIPPSPTTAPAPAASPSPPSSPPEDTPDHIRPTLLANLAHAHLALRAPSAALAAATQLLDLHPPAPPHLALLAHCYLAEAHHSLNHHPEALSHLQAALEHQAARTTDPSAAALAAHPHPTGGVMSPTTPPAATPLSPTESARGAASRSDDDQPPREVHQLGNWGDITGLLGGAARGKIYVNLAAAHAEAGELEDAGKAAAAALEADPGSVKAQAVAAYVSMARGDVLGALSAVKVAAAVG